MKRRMQQMICLATCFLAGVVLYGVVPSAYARTAPTSEAAIKSGYVFNFIKFVEWPSAQDGQMFNVCLLGSDPFANALESLNGKAVRGRPIRVVEDVSLAHTRYCHVVFVSRSESGRLTNALLRLRQAPILTISDIAGFADKGGVIELMTSPSGEIGFRVSKKSADDVGLRVSSKLLSLSR